MLDFEVSFCLVFAMMGLLSVMGMPIRFNHCDVMDGVLQSITHSSDNRSFLFPTEYYPKTIPLNPSTSSSAVPAQVQQQTSPRADKPPRMLVSSGYENEATEVVGTWMGTGLAQSWYIVNSNAKDAWKVVRGSTTQVSSVMSLPIWFCKGS